MFYFLKTKRRNNKKSVRITIQTETTMGKAQLPPFFFFVP